MADKPDLTKATPREPYFVESDDDRTCVHCGAAGRRMYEVIGPDGVAQGMSFGGEEGAYEFAAALNGAHALAYDRHVALIATLTEALEKCRLTLLLLAAEQTPEGRHLRQLAEAEFFKAHKAATDALNHV